MLSASTDLLIAGFACIALMLTFARGRAFGYVSKLLFNVDPVASVASAPPASTKSESVCPTTTEQDEGFSIAKEFTDALVRLAYDVFEPRDASKYAARLNGADPRLAHGQQPARYQGRVPVGALAVQRPAMGARNTDASAESAFQTSAPRTHARGVLTRQGAFHGASHADEVFDSRWWLHPRMDTASSSGVALEHWMRSVRIKRRPLTVVKHAHALGPVMHEERPLEDRFRVAFQKSFPQFDIANVDEEVPYTLWPGYNS
ncbi:hypothetical protein C8Q80DRAFT_1123848 [Daedaleopsis nitida]|nr:hypothetical protein C8Q80DRAFT_1123848 [Daedaleopsis nitida]